MPRVAIALHLSLFLLAAWKSLTLQNSNTLSRSRNFDSIGGSRLSTQLTSDNSNSTTCRSEISRRSLLLGFGLVGPFLVREQDEASALPFVNVNKAKESRVFFVTPDKNASDSLQREQIDLDSYARSSELCLLELLPVKNPIFRGLERSVTVLSSLKTAQLTDPGPWEKARISITEAIATLDTKRGRLEPVFNPEESTMIQIIKGERGEQLIEAFRDQLVELQTATSSRNITRTFQGQKKALLALADVGG